MDDMEVGYRIGKIGKGAFEKGYDTFEKYSTGRLERHAAIEELQKLGIGSGRMRLGFAAPIFEACRQKDALSFAKDRK